MIEGGGCLKLGYINIQMQLHCTPAVSREVQQCSCTALHCLILFTVPADLPQMPPLTACCAELEGLHREVLLRALQLLEAQGKVK
jgi:hypothetical protein